MRLAYFITALNLTSPPDPKADVGFRRLSGYLTCCPREVARLLALLKQDVPQLIQLRAAARARPTTP